MTVRELLARILEHVDADDLDKQVYFMDDFNGDPTEVVAVIVADVVEIQLEDIDVAKFAGKPS